ncbi:MAG: glucose-6-phosphate isomerase [Gammaproteobacteria bacterium]|nr:MAG: glucose-6-phosphate isomerase [Gammaproteobacteria bacterium]
MAYQPITHSGAWHALQKHHAEISSTPLRDLFSDDPRRQENFSAQAAGIHLDYSKNPVTSATLELFEHLADTANIKRQTSALFNGEVVNLSENRPALHTALRCRKNKPLVIDGVNITTEIADALKQMRHFVSKIQSGQWQGYNGKAIRHIVNIGIGGSYLGPMAVAEALRPYWTHDVQCHFIANIDGSEFTEIVKNLHPENTLFIIASKSFGTQETLKNAIAAKAWYLGKGGEEAHIDKHFVAVSSNILKAKQFGIDEANIFPMWDWVGGRYSLWSPIGLPLALTIGMDNFDRLLDGAHAMDNHFIDAPFKQNLPALMAMLQVWQINFFSAQSQAIIPYDHCLRGLPAHLQQLEMESNGKRVSQTGAPIQHDTGAIIWGGAGSNGQHAYHQLFHQGTHIVPVDFIVPLQSHNPVNDHHDILFANCLSQSRVMMHGKTLAEAESELRSSGHSEQQISQLAPQKVIPGNRSNNILLTDKMTPQVIGALVALYEHKVFCQSVIWDINPFDQWGVELGKQIGDDIGDALSDPQTSITQFDSSTQSLIKKYRAAKNY